VDCLADAIHPKPFGAGIGKPARAVVLLNLIQELVQLAGVGELHDGKQILHCLCDSRVALQRCAIRPDRPIRRTLIGVVGIEQPVHPEVGGE